MKIRNSFVSNSSSSSFICPSVSYERVEETMKQLVVIAKMLDDLRVDGYKMNFTEDDYYLKEIKGTVEVITSNDNSIPYEIGELIESILGATRYYLG